MTPTFKRIIGAAGATALLAGAAIVVAPAAQADGNYYGAWTLTAVTANGQKFKCEASNKRYVCCPGGETLTLKTNYRYKASAYIAQALFLGAKGDQKGSFVTTGFPGTGDQVLVLEGRCQWNRTAWQRMADGAEGQALRLAHQNDPHPADRFRRVRVGLPARRQVIPSPAMTQRTLGE